MLWAITYNVNHGKKLSQISKWLLHQTNQFDLLCFQEFPQEKIDWFLAAFPRIYKYTFASNVLKKGQEYGQLTIFNNKKITYKGYTTISLGNGSIVERKVYNAFGERSAPVTYFTYGKRNVYIVNVHLIWFALNRKRREQIKIIIEALKKISLSPEDSILIVGDFNYSSLTQKQGLTQFMNTYSFHNASNNLKTHKLLMFKSLLTHQIDYIFYKNCQIKNIEVVKIHFSDHFPVCFTLKLE